MNRPPTPSLEWDEIYSEDNEDGSALEIPGTETATTSPLPSLGPQIPEASAIDSLEANLAEDEDEGEAVKADEDLLRTIDVYLEEVGGLDSTGHRVINLSRTGKDMLIHAYTGLPRITALSISVLQHIMADSSRCQALLLVPDREEATQFQKVLGDIGKDIKITVDLAPKHGERRLVKSGVHVMIGTPGLVFDLIRQHALKTDGVRILIVDQLDRILLESKNKIVNARRREDHKCMVINFVTDRDQRQYALRGIEQHFKIKIEELPGNVADWLEKGFVNFNK